MIQGFAAKNKDGVLLINTVANTERGASVNWLFTEVGVLVFDHWTDAKITESFRIHSAMRDVTIVPVTVSESENHANDK